jgi:hypothetical protein
MKKLFSLSLVFLIAFHSVFSAEKVLTGIYQGENLFVMNPFAKSGVGFCIFEVTVNGQLSTDEINSSAFEIDLSVYQLQIGDKVTIVIKYKDGCDIKVLNEEVIKPKSTFKVVEILYDRKSSTLKWTSTGEKGPLDFDVEQYRWKKWVNVGKVTGKGTNGPNSYSVKVEPHTGMNKFRVKQVDYSKKPRYSQEATFRSLDPEITLGPERPKNELIFSAETDYEIYDYYGRQMLKGRGNRVDISKLKKGDYFVNWDNSMGQFSKK